MKPLSQQIKRHVARVSRKHRSFAKHLEKLNHFPNHVKKLVSHKKKLHKAVAHHHRRLSRAIRREIGFSLIMLFVGLTIVASGLGLTGNFGLSSQPTVYATEEDVIYAFLGNFYTSSPVIVESPDGKSMVLSGVGAYPDVVAKVNFAGEILAVRRYNSCDWNVDPNEVLVQGNLLGAAVDGTWTVTSSINTLGFPGPYQLRIQGKIFDATRAGDEPIDGCGSAYYAGGWTHVKTWNWHMQSPNTRYDFSAYPLNPVENPVHAKYFHHVSAIPDVNTGLGGQTPFYSDNFNADLTLPNANDPVGSASNLYQYATAPTRWMQYPHEYTYPISGGSPVVYVQKDGVMKVVSQNLFFGGSSNLVLNGYAWSNYIAKYDARATDGTQDSYALGGFTVRFSDPANYIAVQPYTNRDVTIAKIKDSFVVQDLRVIEKVGGGWPEGQYTIEALGNNYKVKVNGITYLEFEDTKSDYLQSEVGFYYDSKYTKYTSPSFSSWDNFRISSL